MSHDDLLTELNALVRDQLNTFDEARSRSLTQAEAEQYAWRKEQIKLLLAEVEFDAA